VSGSDREDEECDGYADGECPQQLLFLPWLVAGGGTATPSVPPRTRWLSVASDCLVGVTHARQVVAG
jgi:hypothetical protein